MGGPSSWGASAAAAPSEERASLANFLTSTPGGGDFTEPGGGVDGGPGGTSSSTSRPSDSSTLADADELMSRGGTLGIGLSGTKT